MIKKASVLLIMLIVALNAFSQSKDAIVGKWLSESGEAQILIYRKGNQFNGKIVWLKNPNSEEGKPLEDGNNPKKPLQKRPLIGLEILQNFVSSDINLWDKGTIYDPKSGKTYSCKMTMPTKEILNIRGYIGISLLGRTESWKKVKL
jgi:uncharacterized protein (DUF2147 family)